MYFIWMQTYQNVRISRELTTDKGNSCINDLYKRGQPTLNEQKLWQTTSRIKHKQKYTLRYKYIKLFSIIEFT